MARYITTWRDEHDPLKWDFYTSEDVYEAERTVGNLIKRGVKHFTTHKLGDAIPDLSAKAPTS